MPTDTGSMELYKSPDQDVQDILRGIDAIYDAPDTTEVVETPSLFDTPEHTEPQAAVIDFQEMARRITENPQAGVDTVVRIGEGITHMREYVADAA